MSVELRNLSFSYNGIIKNKGANKHNSKLKEQTVLKNISFKIEAGKTLGIFGPTGSGKTTIAQILRRFEEVDKNSLFYNGKDSHDWKHSDLRKCISYVPQIIFLFSETILENIKYAIYISDIAIYIN